MIAPSLWGIDMRAWAKFAFVAAAPLLLAGCLWGPGKFASTLALNKNGTFVLDYRGEILLQTPEDKAHEVMPWDDSMARCSIKPETPPSDDPDVIQVPKLRPCTVAEIAKQKADHQKRGAETTARSRKEAEEMGKLFGLPGSDDESNRAFAAKLMKYAGWRSVQYKGKGAFDVDYHFEGRLTQDYVFPLMPDNELIVPFIALRRRTDGSVMMTAPALGGNPFAARAKAMGMPDKSDGPPSHAEGRFTVVTDGEILTNNSEDGPAPHAAGRQLHWDVSPASSKTPEMLVRL
jgi:hypothetical protein